MKELLKNTIKDLLIKEGAPSKGILYKNRVKCYQQPTSL